MNVLCSRLPRHRTLGQHRTHGQPITQGQHSQVQHGFTLMEILVALAIIAIVLGALVQAAGSSAANAGRIRDKTVAQWVASNRLAEMQLSGTFPETGAKSGEAEMLGQTWYWKTRVQEVEDDDLRRVDVEIRETEDAKNPVVTVAGFVSHPRLLSQNPSQP